MFVCWISDVVGSQYNVRGSQDLVSVDDVDSKYCYVLAAIVSSSGDYSSCLFKDTFRSALGRVENIATSTLHRKHSQDVLWKHVPEFNRITLCIIDIEDVEF